MDDLTGGGSSERATGTPNTIYDLSSVLFHALEGGASYDTYIEDAEREGDQELAAFFRRVRDEDSMRADEAQRLLAERSSTTAASTAVEPVEGAIAPSEGLAAGAPRREETIDRVEGRPDIDAAPTDPVIGGAGRVEPDVSPRTEPSLAREGMEESPPPRTSGIEEGAVPRREEAPSRRESVPPEDHIRDEEELRVQRTEEELRAGTREREAGEVRVHKEVRTEREQVRVPKRHEEVSVERVPVEEGREASEAEIGEDEVEIPVTEEEVVTEKRPVVKEEIRVRKDVVQDEEDVEEDVRKEEVDVEDQTERRREAETEQTAQPERGAGAEEKAEEGIIDKAKRKLQGQ